MNLHWHHLDEWTIARVIRGQVRINKQTDRLTSLRWVNNSTCYTGTGTHQQTDRQTDITSMSEQQHVFHVDRYASTNRLTDWHHFDEWTIARVIRGQVRINRQTDRLTSLRWVNNSTCYTGTGTHQQTDWQTDITSMSEQ